MKAARVALDLVDGGAQSPKETWLRLLIVDAGFPRPQTQIPVRNEWGWAEAYLDMGWEDIKVAVEYDGEHHQLSRYHYVKDIRRHEKVALQYGWIVVRVIAEDRPDEIIRRVAEARAPRAGGHLPLVGETPLRKNEPNFAAALPLDSTRLDSTRLDSTRLDSTRLDSTRLDSTRLDSTRLDSTRFGF